MTWAYIKDPLKKFQPSNIQHRTLLEKFKQDAQKSTDIRKKHTAGSVTAIYAARINRGARMVFASHKQNAGPPGLILLNVFDASEHDAYIRYLSKGAIRSYLELLEKNDDFSSYSDLLEENLATADVDNEGDLVKVDEYQSYQEKAIQLTEEQGNLASLSLAGGFGIAGPAGTGKSAVGCEVALQLADMFKYPADEALSVLYLGPPNLVQHVGKSCEISKKFGDYERPIIFQSFDEFVKLHVCHHGGKVVSRQHFLHWIESTGFRKTLEDLRQEVHLLTSVDDVSIARICYEEFSIIVAIGEKYLNCGEKCSRFSTQSRARTLIHKLYIHYCQYLETQKYIDVHVQIPQINTRFTATICDEAHVCPAGLALALLEASSQRSVLYLLDPNQALEYSLLTRKNMLQLSGISFHRLSGTHRTAKLPTLAAERVLFLKAEIFDGHIITGGQAVTLKTSRTDPGYCFWYDSWTESNAQQLQSLADDAGTAFVIFDECERDALIALIGADRPVLMYLPGEILGLEYTNIVLWKPLPMMRAIGIEYWKNLLTKLRADPDYQPKQHRSKQSNSDLLAKEPNSDAANQLFTTLRGEVRVDFYVTDPSGLTGPPPLQGKRSKSRTTDKQLSAIIREVLGIDPLVSSVAPDPDQSLPTQGPGLLIVFPEEKRSTSMDWYDRAIEVFKKGDIDSANRLILRCDVTDKARFNDYQRRHRSDVCRRDSLAKLQLKDFKFTQHLKPISSGDVCRRDSLAKLQPKDFKFTQHLKPISSDDVCRRDSLAKLQPKHFKFDQHLRPILELQTPAPSDYSLELSDHNTVLFHLFTKKKVFSDLCCWLLYHKNNEKRLRSYLDKADLNQQAIIGKRRGKDDVEMVPSYLQLLVVVCSAEQLKIGIIRSFLIRDMTEQSLNAVFSEPMSGRKTSILFKLLYKQGSILPVIIKYISKEGLDTVLSYDGAKNTTPLCLLCEQDHIQKWWPTIQKKIPDKDSWIVMLNNWHGGLISVVALHILCGNPAGLELISSKFDFFVDVFKGRMPDSPYATLQNNTFEKKVSLFRLLSLSSTGIEIMQQLMRCAVIPSEDELNAVTSIGNVTIFYLLVSNPAGIKYLDEGWGVIWSRVHPKTLNRVITRRSPNQGMSPVYCLFGSESGQEFLAKYWYDIWSAVDPDIFNKTVTGEGYAQGATPVYQLCAFELGRQLLSDHWDEIWRKIYSNTLVIPIMAKGQLQGATLIHALLDSALGISILDIHWDELSPYINRYILNRAIVGKGSNQGVTPILYLFKNIVGIQFLQRRFGEIWPKISRSTLNKAVAGEGECQGLTPLHYLLDSEFGRMVFQQHFDSIWPLIDWDTLNQAEGTAASAMPGLTPLHLLCMSPDLSKFMELNWDTLLEKIDQKKLCQKIIINKIEQAETLYDYLGFLKEKKCGLSQAHLFNERVSFSMTVPSKPHRIRIAVTNNKF